MRDSFARRFAALGAAEGAILLVLWSGGAALAHPGRRALEAAFGAACAIVYSIIVVLLRSRAARRLHDPTRVHDAALVTSLVATVAPALAAAVVEGAAGVLFAAGSAAATALAFVGPLGRLPVPEPQAGPGTPARDTLAGMAVALALAGWATMAGLLLGGARAIDEPAGRLATAAALFGPLFVAFTVAMAVVAGRALAREIDRATGAIAEMARSGKLEQPLVVPSADELGALTSALEGLRTKLADELDNLGHELERAQQAQAKKDEFLGAVARELRAPLGAIADEARGLETGVHGELPRPGQRDDARVIEGAARHLLGLLDEVVDLSVLQVGQLRLEPSSMDVAELCRDVVRELHGLVLVARKSVALEADAPAPLPVRADPRRLRQVLTNLVANAIQFTERGHVRVSARQHDGVIEIRVVDTGAGIPEAELERIFQEYRQAQGGGRKGYGLGLAIARRLCELHGGNLSVESRQGAGSTFTITLPREVA